MNYKLAYEILEIEENKNISLEYLKKKYKKIHKEKITKDNDGYY